MPYGLVNLTIVYQRIINDTLRDHINEGNVLVYVDDVILLSYSVREGVELLDRVLQNLTSAGFSINLVKCSFLVTEVEDLDKICQGQVRPSPRKVEALDKQFTSERYMRTVLNMLRIQANHKNASWSETL